MQQQQVSRKSTVLGAILEIIIPGLGFLYAGAGWGRALLMFVVAIVIAIVQSLLQQNAPTIALVLASINLLFLSYREYTLIQFIRTRNYGQLYSSMPKD